MKRLGKYVLKMVTVFLVIMGLGTTALAASGYIQWKGSTDFTEVMENLGLIEQRGIELKGERDLANATNEQLQNTIRDKENIIRDKENLINAKEQEIENLRNQQNESNGQLQQAEKDMKNVNNKSKQVLNGLK